MRSVIIVLLIALTMSCHEELEPKVLPCTTECAMPWILEGTWHWWYTYGPFIDLDYEDVDYSRRIIIMNNLWQEFYNDSLVLEKSFEFELNQDTISLGTVHFADSTWRVLRVERCVMRFPGLFEDSPEIAYCKE